VKKICRFEAGVKEWVSYRYGWWEWRIYEGRWSGLDRDQSPMWKDWYEVVGEKQRVDFRDKVKHDEKRHQLFVKRIMKIHESVCTTLKYISETFCWYRVESLACYTHTITIRQTISLLVIGPAMTQYGTSYLNSICRLNTDNCNPHSSSHRTLFLNGGLMMIFDRWISMYTFPDS